MNKIRVEKKDRKKMEKKKTNKFEQSQAQPCLAKS